MGGLLKGIFFIIMCAANADDSGNRSIPYATYPVPTTYKGPPAPAKLVGKMQNHFRTVIREGAISGPNFAGHFTIVSWGCGTSCSSFVIVNAIDGRVYEPSTPVVGFGDGSLDTDGIGIFYRLDSAVIAINACTEALFVNDDPSCGEHIYVMEKDGLREISFKSMNLAKIGSHDSYEGEAEKTPSAAAGGVNGKRRYTVVPLGD